MVKSIDQAVDEIFKDYKNAIRAAAQEAINKAKDDIYNKSLSCLLEYYGDYSPTSYGRTYSLMNSFVPYADPVSWGGDSFNCAAGVEYNSALIGGAYSGSRKYTPTDSEWVLDNYLDGIHPRTDGSRVPGGGNYGSEIYIGSVKPDIEMNKFIDSYYGIFDANFRSALSRMVLGKMGK